MYVGYSNPFGQSKKKQMTRTCLFWWQSKAVFKERLSLCAGHGDPMDFWDHKHWRKIQQNDPHANVPTFMTPHLVKHSQPNIKLILLLREPAERYIFKKITRNELSNSLVICMVLEI